jgi:hypothetical protein
MPALELARGDLLEAFQLAARGADACGVEPLVAEEVLGHGPALAFFEHQVRHRHLHLVEEHLVHLTLPVHEHERPHGDARALHVDEEERNPFLLLRGRVGPHEAEDPVGVVRERRPGLLALDDIVVALARRARLEGREIRACARLRVALAPEVVAVVDAREETLFLRGRAELEEHRGAHREPERNEGRSARVTALLLEDVTLHDRPVGAAPLLRPGRRDPPLLGEDPVPAQEIVAGQVGVRRDRLVQVPGEVRREPGPDVVAKRELVGGIVEVHGAEFNPVASCKLPFLRRKPLP